MFSSIKEEKQLGYDLMLGVTNPLFTKSLQGINHVLRLDQEFEKTLGSDKAFTDIKPKAFLFSKNKPKIKSNLNISNLMTLGNTPEIIKINNLMVRKRLLELTMDFVEPFHLYYEKQYNVK